MANLANRLAELQPRIGSLRDANDERSVVQALRARSTQVASARQSLEEAIDAFRRVERFGGMAGGRPRASVALKSKPIALSERVVANPSDATDNAQWATTFLTPLSEFTVKVQQATLVAWQSIVDKRAPPTRDDLLDSLDRGGFGARVRQVRAARDQIRELRNRIPTADSALETIEALGQSITKELATLEAVPTPVRLFISRANRQEATLEDLTKEVKDWLHDRDMLKLVRLGFSK